ncbi:glycosyltransferase family 2 protein [Geobacter pickeringii]|uniref:glycosyltransferase family 2 protein n=1 Tax=Geobacter pickeringii TaxID=345632 RepID=UPI00130E3AF5|nr:glycosyltransferase [Geobacter pickeringii]
MKFSIVILYFNRSDNLNNLLKHLGRISAHDVEIIVVDNNSEVDLQVRITSDYGNVKYLRLDNNAGAVGRNRGIAMASGEIVICLDDDILGISDEDLTVLEREFCRNNLAGVCFKVIDPYSNEIMNWCHHYDKMKYSDISFNTNEISEGAVAIRKSVLNEVGLYPESFFISHEGPDLACRVINKGYSIIYSPNIVVKHFHSDIGRATWRRYYYDTRNVVWLSVRNYPFWYGLKKIFLGVLPMLIYSIRDGYVKYWVKGVVDAILGLGSAIRERNVLTSSALKAIKDIEKNRINFFELVKVRLFRKNIKI